MPYMNDSTYNSINVNSYYIKNEHVILMNQMYVLYLKTKIT